MTNPQDVEDAMGQAAHHAALAVQHQRKSQQYLDHAIALVTGGAGAKLGANHNGPKCLRVWAKYLDENGPSLRQEIQDETGVRFTERATPYTVTWDDGMATYGDEHFAPDTIVRMRSVRNADGRAGTSTAYFLWSQRFDVFDRFGVGPKGRVSPALLGVVHPPTEQEAAVLSEAMSSDTVTKTQTPAAEPDAPEYERFATMDEWNERWVPLFDSLAPYGEAPTAEEKAEMIATLPEDTGGEPWSTILARTSHEARLRSQS